MMKVTKFLSALAILAFISVGTTSCSSDDNVIRPEKPDENGQTEVGTELHFEGTYAYGHAGNPIPFDFKKKSISMQMSLMAGSGQEDDLYNIIKIYKNTDGVLKVVSKHETASEYKAFFLRNIKEGESLDINIDYSFTSEIEAIKAVYPASGNSTPDHANNKFGWLKLTKMNGEPSEKINLPVQGKYVFSAQGHTYFYNFSNTVVNFNGDYDMTVLKHNTNTNKILLEGKGEKAGTYYVTQLKNITANTVDIARLTFGEADAKTKAEAEFALATDLTGGRFTTYTKEGSEGGETIPAFEGLNGTYVSATIGNNLGYYQFTMGENNEAFLFMGDFAGSGTFDEGGKLELKKVFADKAKGQIIFEITNSEGYYAERNGQFLTLYVKDYADGTKATFAIATKGGVTSISTSKGNVIGTTLEEAKALAAPDAMKAWDGGMMAYAHVWIPTTKK
ncbi:hypothetical protein [Myroides odoratus]|uniref:AZL_007920/MXAN_0976 family protein n=1 Tax=Myroides odoratus TaxID=256 RepID=A0A9Q6Z4R5_MYROD|nr:hypothetical protein [Myroides odoratus]EHQ43056.1 hypothetical protein Myrod_2230 [Myroides odoratus DSM 2801]EKB06782.1 hypothetical protein HMPREF9716_02092 [Myroides odoratus CIP 103059]QQU00401.1 hypothetical protein I6I88_01110 [Myroides odoratus]WQD57366.1 hypothetical protein U0010_17920 [Myroides odoratus]STZ30326.1 Uncharacterised protein [Myroides odoratus]